MRRTFTASRISEGNVLFPPTIIFDDNGVTVRCPFIFSGKSTYIPYNCISSVHIETPKTPIIGFMENIMNRLYIGRWGWQG